MKLIREMCTAYGIGFNLYGVEDTDNIDLYSFEFNSLLSSLPASEADFSRRNRGGLKMGLAHSVVLAKHSGVEKLKAIRHYYDDHHVPLGRICENAFKFLNEQPHSCITDDTPIWMIFESDASRIPLLPYRMQTMALWDVVTNC